MWTRPPPGDPRVPGRTRGREATLALVYGSASIGLLGVTAYLAETVLIFPSLGPTAFLLFHRPTASAASPRNVLAGHVIGVVCGLFALTACGLFGAPSALRAGVTLSHAAAAALSLGTTSALMVLFDRGHPPAGATTLIISLGLMSDVWQVAALLAAVVVLIAQAWLVHKVAGTFYPAWAPRGESASPSEARPAGVDDRPSA